MVTAPNIPLILKSSMAERHHTDALDVFQGHKHDTNMKKQFNQNDGWWRARLSLKPGTPPPTREEVLALLTAKKPRLYEVGEYKQYKTVITVVLRKLPNGQNATT